MVGAYALQAHVLPDDVDDVELVLELFRRTHRLLLRSRSGVPLVALKIGPNVRRIVADQFSELDKGNPYTLFPVTTDHIEADVDYPAKGLLVPELL